MIYSLFVISYLLDAILLAFILIFIVLIIKLQNSLGQKFTFLETLKLIPLFLTNHIHHSFHHHAKKNSNGTFQVSYYNHAKLKKITKSLVHGTLGFLALKLILTGMIFWYIPKPTEAVAQPFKYTTFDQGFLSFNQGTRKLTDIINNTITISAGEYNGNYISKPLGDGQKEYYWQTLAWEADRKYNVRPEYPSSVVTAWSMDSLESCADTKSKTYNCKLKNITLTPGLYRSNAYTFDGDKSKAKIESNLSIKDSFTIGTWVKFTEDTMVGSAEQDYAFLAKGYGDYYNRKTAYQLKYNYFFGILDGALTFKYWSDDNQNHWGLIKDNNVNFSQNRWYHLAVTYDSKTKIFKLYIDGIEHSEVVADYDGGALNHYPNASVNLPSWIGGIGYLWMDNEEIMVDVLKGSLDELFVANTSMNILDIRNIVNQSGEVYFQVRTGNQLPLTGNFWGPDYRLDNYFTQTQVNNLNFLQPSKYLQYITYLSRPTTNFNPKLLNVTVEYTDTKVEQASNLKITLPTVAATNTQTGTTVTTRNVSAEKDALNLFITLFKVMPASTEDWQFINLIAYNQGYTRDLNKEKNSLTGFNKYYKRLPNSNIDWGLIRALAYSTKGQTLLSSWLKIK